MKDTEKIQYSNEYRKRIYDMSDTELSAERRALINEAHELAREVLTNCKDEYAKTYARSIGEAGIFGMEGIHTQLLYIRCNTNSWRGPTARAWKAKQELLGLRMSAFIFASKK